MTSSVHPVDLAIFGVFLLATLVVGLNYGRQVKTLKDYALGGKDFSTATLVATIVATGASGSALFIDLENTYTDGLYYVIASMGYPLNIWLMGQLAIRMEEFMDHVSVAEAMGSMYGRTVQIITACSSVLGKVGYIAIQFKVIAKVLEVLFHLDGTVATSTSAAIVIVYSSLGGIKAVTFTDVLQFVTFGIVIPILAIVVWSSVQASGHITPLADHPNFDLRQVLSWDKKLFSSIGLLSYFAIPGISPQTFQRIAMAQNIRQARRAFTYSAGILLLIFLAQVWVGTLILIDRPGLAKDQVVSYMISQYTYVGLVGLLGAGVMALAMSTADSVLNSLSVIFANDLVKPLARKAYSSVTIARSFSVVAGLLALLLALYSKDILKLLLLSGSFYLPVFTVPMLISILGFRTSSRGIMAGMATGFITVILWSIFLTNADSVVPGMAANLLVLLSSHYLFGEPGGWKKVDPDSLLGRERAARKEAWKRRREALSNFSLYQYLRSKLPHQDHIYFFFGLYAMAANYLACYTINPTQLSAYQSLHSSIVPGVLFITAVFLTLPIWPSNFKGKRFITLFWPLGMAALLFLAGTLIAIMSHFQPVQMMVLLFNLLVAVLLLPGALVLPMAFFSVSLALLVFKLYTGLSIPWATASFLQFEGFYGLMLLTCFLIAFFRYQQNYQQISKKNQVLQSREKDQQASLLQIAAEKQAALSALQHSGVGELLTIARELQTLHIAAEDKERLQALQTKLIPIAFHLQGLDTRAQDYLRLQIGKLPLQSWCDQIKEAVGQRGITTSIHYKHNTNHQELGCDPDRLTSLLVSSIAALSARIEASQPEDQPIILLALEDTQLSYSLPDVAKGYIKRVPALRIAITAGEHLPALAPSYSPNLAGPDYMAPETPQDLEQLTNSRIIKSHYGYAEITDHALVYVVPIDIEAVRPKDMDKAYMEVGAPPKRANDHFKNNKGIDAQAQEKAFLSDVAARSQADLGLIKTALELIKWYHGPKGRHSGEPFYLHPLAVAQIVLAYNQDEATIIGALLHDTVEDTPMLLQHIEAMFGKKTAEVVDVVTHLQSIEDSIYKIKLSASENLQMLERTGNKRGLYVKLADRMHNMRTINGHSRLEKKKLIAEETMQFFVPLAERLGLQKTAQEFEELCVEVFRQSE